MNCYIVYFISIACFILKSILKKKAETKLQQMKN